MEGKAAGIGSTADRRTMRTLRSKVDAVMIGAGTLRAEKLSLGLDPTDPAWGDGGGGVAEAALGRLVETLIADRRAARDARDFASADRIRDALSASGIAVADGKDDTTWSIA